jgi:hypothetical protein
MRSGAHSRLAFIAIFAICFCLLASSAYAQQRQALQTEMSAPVGARLIGRLPSSQQLRLTISLPLRNEEQLNNLLQQLYDPSSPNYRHFLTAQQFTEEFGPSVVDYQRVIDFAQSHGLKALRTFPNRLVISVSGTVASVEQTFQVRMQVYQHPTEDRTFYAPSVEPTVDAGLPVLSVDGLSTLNLPHSMLKKSVPNWSVQSEQTGSGPGGQFLASDMRVAYAGSTVLNGSGQAIGLIELGPYRLTDVLAYFSSLNQPLNVPIVNVLLDVDGVCSGLPPSGCDDGEEVIDIQQAISMAPNASALIVYEAYGSGSDALTAYTQAATDNIAKQMSISFGWTGTPSSEASYEQIFQELAAQGQSSFVASGDAGASIPGSGTSGGGYPGNSPNITDAGGTDLTTNGAAGAWQSETGWIGSGGGWNNQSPIPTYQTPVITTSNGGDIAYRNIPDVAAEANTDNYFCANGSCQGGIGGTSLAAPRWAGFVALINQQATANSTVSGNAPLGFLNPTIYTDGQGANYGATFHDITTGDNANGTSCTVGTPGCLPSGVQGFNAVTGFDLVTGWGSPNGPNIFTTLFPSSSNANFAMSATPSVLPLTPGNGGTSSIAATALHGFSAVTNLSVTIPGAPAGMTANLNASTIAAGGGPVTLTISTTSVTPGGTYVVVVTGISGGLTQSAYVTLELPAFIGLTATPAAGLSLNQGGTASSTVTVDGINGFNGSVSLSASGLPTSVTASFVSTGATTSTVTFSASATAALTGAGSPAAVTISGTSSGFVPQSTTVNLFVNPAATGGSGTAVDLTSVYNVYAFYTDSDEAAITATNSLDGVGYTFSANLLNSDVNLNGTQFTFGPANEPDAVANVATPIALPTGSYTTLQLLATGIEGNQASQTVTVTYTDESTSQFTQSFSDWCSYLNGGGCTSTGNNSGESVAVAMPYRDSAGGTDNRVFYLYHYSFALNTNKMVQSLTLPGNRDVVVLAATLAGPVATGFTLASAPGAISVAQGGSNTSTITVTPTGGFTGSVTLAASGLPAGITASFNPASTATTSVLTLTASGTAATGPSTVTITGTSGSLTQTSTVGLTVAPPANYSLSAGAANPASITPDGSAQASVTVASTNGYTGTVTLSCAITSTVAFTAAQASCSFGNTSPVTVSSSGGTATVTFSTVASSAMMLRRLSMLFALILPIPGLSLVALGLGSAARRRRKLGWLLFWMVLAGLLILPACGGGSSGSGGSGGSGGGPPAGTYTITITGKDANDVTQTGNSPTVTVTVN